ncbi:hypothetical protein [Agrobacterium larrymoorei]|uniref:hypothetical protein n=1 Tax=Agrobacterium larrymoorei TaxID=160699 RepID=UPI00286A5C95|nr:hypothetical protein [Agrobacterium larrymoorei]
MDFSYRDFVRRGLGRWLAKMSILKPTNFAAAPRVVDIGRKVIVIHTERCVQIALIEPD